jgi:hypothetical protein
LITGFLAGGLLAILKTEAHFNIKASIPDQIRPINLAIWVEQNLLVASYVACVFGIRPASGKKFRFEF